MRGWASPNLRSAPPHPGCGGGGDGGALAGRLGDGAPGLAGWPTRRGRPWSARGEWVGENGVDGVCARGGDDVIGELVLDSEARQSFQRKQARGDCLTIAQLAEHLTVVDLQTSECPWFASEW